MTLSTNLLEDLRARRRKIIAGGGEEKSKERHDKGLMTARERLGALFQPEAFQEIGMHVCHSGRYFGMDTKEMPADGVITGTGYVNASPP